MGRFDDMGLFWQDTPKSKKAQRTMPPIPKTGWKAPTTFPNLSGASVISLDIEGYDPELLTRGPGWARGVGHIIGVSIGTVTASGATKTWYFPWKHETMPEDNLEEEHVKRWLRDTLGDANQPKVGANIGYDVGWLEQEGIKVAGELIDVQFAEALLDESAKVSLEALGQKYLNEGKESNTLYEWLADWFGGTPGGAQRKHMYKTPPCLAGPYAESDADLPLRLIKVMYPLLVKEGLYDLFIMECRLIRLMNAMRMAGVHVDVGQAKVLREDLIVRSAEQASKITTIVGSEINLNSSAQLAWAFDKLGIKYGKTAKGAPSFTGAFLKTVEHPIGALIQEVKKLDKLRGTFIESYILEAHIDNMVYGQFHQLRGDEGGTRSGRFSSSNPNLQNIPSRDEELAPMIRGLYIPDPGHVAWRKYDYSQVEYRMLIHYAIGEAGREIRAFFNAHPDTDYHVYAQDVVKSRTGVEVDRKRIKTINFGLIYGMGVSTLAAGLGMRVSAAKALMKAYFEGVPFAKPTMEAATAEAQKTGVISTILGRKSRFDLWESNDWAKSKNGRPLPYEQAIREYGGRIQRSQTHKALNRRLQGSSADVMKMAMLRCYEEGIFDATGVPRLTVHDELDFSDPGGVDDAFIEMKRVMETALPFSIPFKADGEIGPDWGHVHDIP